MKFEGRSKTLLAITKSKAKMYEYNLPEEDHIDLRFSPTNLLVMTVGMLGDLCRLELESDTLPEAEQVLDQSRRELRDAARYFDAFHETRISPEHAYYIMLLSASAYYLADMPGSSSVLISQAKNYRVNLTNNGLEQFLDWLLKCDLEAPFVVEGNSTFSNELVNCFNVLQSFYRFKDLNFDNVIEAGNILREKVHEKGSDRELLFSDIIAATIKRRMNTSSVKWLPESSNMPIQDWLPALRKSTFVKEYWPAQRLLSVHGVFSGSSAIVQLPTSAGKTKSSEIILRSSFISGRSSLAILVAPYRSLCREITDSFSAAFQGEDVSVNQLNDLPQIDEWDEQILERILNVNILDPQKTILVSTPEKLVYLLRHQPELKEKIGLLIFDEGHQFDTGTRGVTYELLLASLKRSISPQTQIVLISAVISNAQTIGDWLYGEEGTIVDGASFIATERSIAFAGWTAEKGQLHYISPENPDREEYFVPKVLEQTKLPLRGQERVVRYFPDKKDKSSVAAYLAFKLSISAPVAVFCGTKVIASSVCKKMLEAKERLDELTSPIENSDPNEIRKLHYLAEQHFGAEYNLTKAIALGILPHSRGVPMGLRAAIEFAMENSLARCVVCTSTLAQGVNLPIKYLVISGVSQGESNLTTRDFHNLIGRAGRSGKHTEGSIIFADTEIYDRRLNQKRYQWASMKALLDPSNSERCVSSLKSLVEAFSGDPFLIKPLDFVRDPDKTRSLFIKAAGNQGLDEKIIDSILRQMKERERYIEAIESYLLSLPEAADEQMSDALVVSTLQDTLAFFMSNDIEKKQLYEIFSSISQRITALPPEKRAPYGKALLGLDSLHEIEAWIAQTIEQLDKAEDPNSLIDTIWPLLLNLTDSKLIDSIEPSESVVEMAKRWITGDSYAELLQYSIDQGVKYNTAKRSVKLNLDQVIELCDNVMGFQMMLIVGAIADLMESHGTDEALINKVRNCQASIKLGFNSSLEHWFYSKGIVDRAICKDLKLILGLKGYDPENFPLDLLDREKATIESVLLHYPKYYSNQIS